MRTQPNQLPYRSLESSLIRVSPERIALSVANPTTNQIHAAKLLALSITKYATAMTRLTGISRIYQYQFHRKLEDLELFQLVKFIVTIIPSIARLQGIEPYSLATLPERKCGVALLPALFASLPCYAKGIPAMLLKYN